MATLALKTRSEQKLEWLSAERGVRRLSDEEWRELARAEHAIYCRNRRLKLLAMHEAEEAALLERVLAEAATSERSG
jgi:hypothetical protein